MDIKTLMQIIAGASFVVGCAIAIFKLLLTKFIGAREAHEEKVMSLLKGVTEQAGKDRDEFQKAVNILRSERQSEMYMMKDTLEGQIQALNAHMEGEVKVLRERSHTLANDLGILVATSRLNAEAVSKTQDQVQKMSNDVTRLTTIINERLPGKLG
jgi:hypothetical protein